MKKKIEWFETVVINSSEWNDTVCEMFIRGIENNESDEAAAVNAGLSLQVYRRWLKTSESFKAMVDSLVAAHNSKFKKIIEAGIVDGELDDKDQVSLAMKHLERIDPEYGKKFKCRLMLTEDSDVLQVRGYIAFLYSTQYWERIK